VKRARYLGLFLEEARQHIEAAYVTLERFEARPQQPDTLHALMRHCHSLKGMAATMGFEPFVELAHRMEGLLRELERRPRMWSRELAPLFREGLDQLNAWSERIADGDAPTKTAATRTLVERLDTQLDEPPIQPSRTPAQSDPETPALWSVRLSLHAASASPAHRIVSTLQRVSTLGRILRVRPPHLPLDDEPDAMELYFELASPRSPKALRRRLLQFAWVSDAELSKVVRAAPRSGSPELPTIWTRVPADALDWIADTLRALAMERSAGAGGSTTQRVSDDRSTFLIKRLFDRVDELRSVPIMSLSHRLEPAVRDAARRDGKKARFRIHGGEFGLDRVLLDRLVGPLRHLVRNAIAHGIESPLERRAAGKSEEGEIHLTVKRDGDHVNVSLTDDGRGMDPLALRRAAVQAGEIDAPAADALDDSAALQLALRPGVTTRPAADDVAGRGSGLDAVRRDLEELGAQFELTSTPGQGSRFVFGLPLRQAFVQSIVFRRAGQLFGIPLLSVRRATSADAHPSDLDIVDLGDGPPGPAPAGYLLILDEPERPVALIADEVIGRRELWIQPLAQSLSAATYANGAALIENGAMAVMIDPKKLVAHPS